MKEEEIKICGNCANNRSRCMVHFNCNWQPITEIMDTKQRVALIREKENDELAMSSKITDILKEYAERWGNPKIWTSTTTDWFSDKNSGERSYIVNCVSKIVL